MEPVKHLKWSFLQKTLTAYSRKQFSQERKFERYVNNTSSYFDESCSWQLLTHPLNLWI